MNEILLNSTDDDFLNDVPPVHEFEQGNEILAELSKQGYNYIKQNDIEAARAAFLQILETDSTNNYALVGLGDAERKSGKFYAAIEYYNRCLIKYPENKYALFGLADCYKALNQYRKAIEIWEKYLTKDENNVTVLTRIADAYRKIHDFKNSKTIYLRVLDIEENNVYALIGLGHLHYDFKDYKNALEYWSRMLSLTDSTVDIRVLTSLGNCHRKLKTFALGIPYFERALLMEPNNFYALFGMADCYRGLGDHKNSIVYWQKILDIDPQNKIILTRLGDAYRTLGEIDKALECYNKTLEIDFDVYAALGLALICKAQEKYNEAIERFNHLIDADPKNYRPYIELSECYVAMNKKQEALETLALAQRQGLYNQAISSVVDKISSVK